MLQSKLEITYQEMYLLPIYCYVELQPFALYQGVDDPFGNLSITPITGWGAGDLRLEKWLKTMAL
jgi:hypothetical protein